MSKVMLEVRDLTTKYVTRYKENVYAVDHVSLKIEEGKTLGIAGESGCGKSTLALSLMGYYFPPLHYTSGDIIIDGQNISGMKPDDVRKSILGREIAYIPQAAMNALNPTRKIIDFIGDVVRAHEPTWTKQMIYDHARKSFELLGLPAEVLQKYPVELSGGMKQRTVIAVAVILSPKVLIADEPSSALDVTSQKMVIKMLRDMMESGFIKAMIFITHELPLLYNVADEIMVMYAGQIVEHASAKASRVRSASSLLQGPHGFHHRAGKRPAQRQADGDSWRAAQSQEPTGRLSLCRTLQICAGGMQGDSRFRFTRWDTIARTAAF
jgi:peptide/nickel transport system ATP-binding protein